MSAGIMIHRYDRKIYCAVVLEFKSKLSFYTRALEFNVMQFGNRGEGREKSIFLDGSSLSRDSYRMVHILCSVQRGSIIEIV